MPRPLVMMQEPVTKLVGRHTVNIGLFTSGERPDAALHLLTEEEARAEGER